MAAVESPTCAGSKSICCREEAHRSPLIRHRARGNPGRLSHRNSGLEQHFDSKHSSPGPAHCSHAPGQIQPSVAPAASVEHSVRSRALHWANWALADLKHPSAGSLQHCVSWQLSNLLEHVGAGGGGPLTKACPADTAAITAAAAPVCSAAISAKPANARSTLAKLECPPLAA
eukprot:scaffold23570_cov112-Isochrysis_galbana.AAC.2